MIRKFLYVKEEITDCSDCIYSRWSNDNGKAIGFYFVCQHPNIHNISNFEKSLIGDDDIPEWCPLPNYDE